MFTKKRILIAVLGLLVLIQFIRPAKNNGTAEGPGSIEKKLDVPDSELAILKTSCYDCHSNKTNYPWYSEVMPFGWFLAHHVDEGKAELNFTEFDKYNPKRMDHKLEETIEMLEEGEMPLSSYTIVHSDAKLNAEQKQLLIDWVKKERLKIKF